MKTYILIVFILLSISFGSCTKDKVKLKEVEVVDPNCPKTISYSTDIAPIMSLNCNTPGCHNTQSAMSGYIFETFSQVSLQSNAILTYSAADSPNIMPLSGTLPDSVLAKIRCWVSQGKKNN